MRIVRRARSARFVAAMTVALLLAMVCLPTLSAAETIEPGPSPFGDVAGISLQVPDGAKEAASGSGLEGPAGPDASSLGGERKAAAPYKSGAVEALVNTFGDAYEVDDTVAQARAITADGTPQSHTFHVPADEDWVKFSVAGGADYLVQTSPGTSGTDTVVELYDADGATLLASDDNGGYHDGFSRLEFSASADGVRYVRVHGAGFEETGAYVLTIEAETPDADAYEPDDTMAEAKPIAAGSVQSRTYHQPSDDDWVSFEAVAGNTYEITTLPGTYGLDTYLRLYDSEGVEIMYDDDGGFGNYSFMAYTPTVTGTVYVLSYSYGHNYTGRYLLSVNAIPATGDAYEPDDTAGEAKPITVGGGAQTRSFHVEADEDWVVFNAIADVTYVMETHVISGVDTYMYLYDSGLAEITTDDDSGVDYCSRIEYTADADGPLYIRLHSYSHDAAGSYALTVDGLLPDAYEVDDTSAAAKPIGIEGTPQSRTFHAGTDDDWVTFPVVAGLTYTIETLPGSDDLDTELTLYGPTLAELDYDDDDGTGYYSHITYTATANAQVYVRANTLDHAETGFYRLAVDCTDVTPPVTVSNAVSRYTRSASITLAATDPAPGVGVATTRYVLDGGAEKAYTGPITVSSIGTHTLKFWSVDHATNDEAPKSVTFTVAAARTTSTRGTGGTGDTAAEASVEPTAAVVATAAPEPIAAEEPPASDEVDDEEQAVTTAVAGESADETSSTLWYVLGGVGLLALLGALLTMLKKRKP